MMEWIIAYATLLDIIMGDPRSIPHPVGSIAKAIQAGESMIRRYFTSDRALKWAGVGLAIIIVGGALVSSGGYYGWPIISIIPWVWGGVLF
jgi:adenosylcobinamide-phosphate synthase